MKSAYLFILLFYSCTLSAQERFQLAPPLLQYPSVFFEKQTWVEIKFAQAGTSIHYTLNNNEPTEKDAVYTGPVRITRNLSVLKAKVFGPDFNPSETVSAQFIRSGIPVQSVQYTLPDAKYPGSGSRTLIDNKGGLPLVSNPAWMGYRCDTVAVTMELGKKQRVKELLLHFLQSESSWIFLPEEIQAFWFDEKNNRYQLLGKAIPATDQPTPGTRCVSELITAKKKTRTHKILINILVKRSIPAWHTAKGEHAWMFIDEIKI